jgi:hypothetical protein
MLKRIVFSEKTCIIKWMRNPTVEALGSLSIFESVYRDDSAKMPFPYSLISLLNKE